MAGTTIAVTESKARVALLANKSDAESALDRAGTNPRWEASWSTGINPGEMWDTAAPCKALENLLQERVVAGREDAFVGKNALVPGCGRAYVNDNMTKQHHVLCKGVSFVLFMHSHHHTYTHIHYKDDKISSTITASKHFFTQDAIALATVGFTATGLDLAPTAVKNANNWLANITDGRPFSEKFPGSVEFRCGNFFDEHKINFGHYDLIFDCTFLCAIHPDAYIKWSEEMAKLIKKGGELVTLIYPINKKILTGPPYPMSTELVSGLLSSNFDLVSMRNPLPKELHHLTSNRLNVTSALACWRRK